MANFPCAARPGTEFFHPEGSCQCFFGGPAPTFPPEENPNRPKAEWWDQLVEATTKTRDAFDGFAEAMLISRNRMNKPHGPASKKRHSKDRLHVKLR